MIFKNRKDGAKKLLPKLLKFKNDKNAVVLAILRGGIILAYEIARELNLPIDIIIAQKISAPDSKEFAIGAITEYEDVFFNEEIISSYKISQEYIEKEKQERLKEIDRRIELYRKNKKPIDLQNKTVILVDDGIATGATTIASIKSIKKKKAKKIIVATPVIAPDSLTKIQKLVDQVIYLDAPLSFLAVGEFYESFDQVGDNQVIEFLEKSHEKKR